MCVGENFIRWERRNCGVKHRRNPRNEERFAFLDQCVPGEFAVPRHVHHAEDEERFVLEGDMAF